MSRGTTWAEQSYCCEPKYCRTSVHKCGSPPLLTSPSRAHASMRPAWSPAAISTCNRAQASQVLLAGMDNHRVAQNLHRVPEHFWPAVLHYLSMRFHNLPCKYVNPLPYQPAGMLCHIFAV